MKPAYRPTNRIHAPSRWPADLVAARELAVTDLDFLVVLNRIGCDIDSDGGAVSVRKAAAAMIVRCERHGITGDCE